MINYAKNAHWNNPTVSYQSSYEYVQDTSRSFDVSKIVGVSISCVLLLCVMIGSCVEVTTIGDDPDFNKETLKRLSRFRSTKQYETVVM